MKINRILSKAFGLLLALIMLLPTMAVPAMAANTAPGPIYSADVSAKWALTAPTSYTATTYDFSISQAAEPAFQFTDYLEYGLYNGRTNFPNTGTAVYETLSGGGEKVTLYSTLGKASTDADKQAPVYIRLKAKYDVTITFSLAADTSGTANGFHTYATKFDEKNIPEANSINPKAGATKKNWGYQYTLSTAANLNAFNGLTNQTVELKAEESMIVGVSYSSARSKNRWVSLTIHDVKGPAMGNLVKLTSQNSDITLGKVDMTVSDSSVTVEGAYQYQKSAQVPNGAQVTATAIPSGYHVFTGWYKAGTETLITKQNPYTFTPTDITDLEARFADAYKIEFDVESANYGTLQVYSQDGELLLTLPDEKNVAFGSVLVHKTENLTLKAIPKEDYAFTFYQGEYRVTNANGETVTKYPTLGTGQWWNDNAYTFKPSSLSWLADSTTNYINVLFKFESNVLTYFNPAEGGTYTIGGQEITADNTKVYTAKDGDWGTLAGLRQNLMTWTATPDTYYRFVGWWDASDGKYLTTYDANGNALPQNTATVQRLLTETYKHTVYPVFESDGIIYTQTFQPVTGATYTVTSEAGTYTVSNAPVEVTYLNGENLTVKLATLEEGYEFTGWSNGSTATSIKVVGGTAVQPTVKRSLVDITVTGSPYGTYTISQGSTVIKTVAKNAAAETLRLDPSALYTFSFTPDSNATFLRWYNGSAEFTTSATFQNYVTDGMSIVPDAVPNTYALFTTSKGTFGYLDLAGEVAAGTSDKLITVTRSGTVMHSKGEKNITIPAGVKLVVPHNDHATANGSGGSFPYGCVTSVDNSPHPTNPDAPGSNTYLKLTVPKDTTINVLGVMSVGGAVAGNGQIVKNDTHSEVYLNEGASIVVGAPNKYSGVLSVCGFVYGPGEVEVLYGNNVYVPFTVNDFRAGGYTVGVAAKIAKCSYDVGPYLKHASGEQAIMPFNRYSMEAIQCDQVINYGGRVNGYADLWAASQHNTCVMSLIGDEYTEALIKQMSADSYITIEYDGSKKLDNVGRMTLTMYGTVDFGSMTLRLPEYGAEIATSGVYFPIPYNFDIVVKGQLNVRNAVKLMPGASLTVDGTMTVVNGLFIYDALHDYGDHGVIVTNNTNKTSVLSEFKSEYPTYNPSGAHDPYPTTAQLEAVGLSGSAELTVNGTLNLHSGTKVAGIIQTSGAGATINTQSGITTALTLQEGGIGYWYVCATGSYEYGYSHVGATVRTLKAHVVGADGKLHQISAGKTYQALSGESKYSITSYTYDLYYATSWSGEKNTNNDALNTNAKKAVTENVSLPQYGTWACTSHTFDAGVATTPATCTAPGVLTKTCTTCGTTTTEPIQAVGHTHGNAVVENNVAPTCGKAGSYDNVVYCVSCGAQISRTTVTVAATGNHADGNSDHNCDVCGTAMGTHAAASGKHTCDYCGQTVTQCADSNDADHKCDICGKDNITEHTYGSATYAWGNDGKSCTATRRCACGHQETATATITSAVKTAATCTVKGTTTYTATFSNASWAATQTKDVQDIAVSAHTEKTREEDRVAATCGQAGTYKLVTYCSACNTVIKTEDKTIAATGAHTYDNACDIDCNVCGHEREITHSYNAVVTAPTCAAAGYTTYTCSVCGDTYTGNTVAATGHRYTSEVTTPPACTTAGVKTYTCSGCGHSYTEPISATGHNMVAGQVVAPTCEADGYTVYTCANGCGTTENKDVVEAKGHNMKETAAAVNPTCTATGLTAVYTCANGCGKTEGGAAIDALGHNLVDVVGKDATCTEDGYTAHKDCSRCDYIEGKTVIPAGHTLTEVEAQAPTCTAIGWDAYEYCTECDYTTYVEKAALGHTPAEAVEENRIEATGTMDGSYDSVVYCSVCSTELSRETITIPATGEPEEEVDITINDVPNAENTGITVEAEVNGGVLVVDTVRNGESENVETHVHMVTVVYSDGTEEVLKNTSGNYRDGAFALPEGVVSVSISSCLMGDVVMDGDLNIIDAVEILKIAAKKVAYEGLQELAAHTMEGSEITINDAVKALKVAALKETY